MTSLFEALVEIYKAKSVKFPKLKGVTLAQWALESGWGSSKLSKHYFNFAGLKFRPEMSKYAMSVEYTAHDGVDQYCRFCNIDAFIDGYWGFIARPPYRGFDKYSEDPKGYIEFLKSCGYASDPNYVDKVLRVYADMIEKGLIDGESIEELPEEVEPERPSYGKPGQRLDYCPFGETYNAGMPSRGWTRYKGAIVHHTAGHNDGDRAAKATASYGGRQGLTYWIISSDGSIFMTHPLDSWGYHCGTRHHRDHLGIEICGGGKLQGSSGNWRTWFNKKVLTKNVRWVSRKKDNQQRGAYEKFTPQQEQSLINLLCWLKHNDPEAFSFDNVLGHDEILPGEKNDPGGSLSMTMPALRKRLESVYSETYGQRKVKK
jgi:hypothetical protein